MRYIEEWKVTKGGKLKEFEIWWMTLQGQLSWQIAVIDADADADDDDDGGGGKG